MTWAVLIKANDSASSLEDQEDTYVLFHEMRRGEESLVYAPKSGMLSIEKVDGEIMKATPFPASGLPEKIKKNLTLILKSALEQVNELTPHLPGSDYNETMRYIKAYQRVFADQDISLDSLKANRLLTWG